MTHPHDGLNPCGMYCFSHNSILASSPPCTIQLTEAVLLHLQMRSAVQTVAGLFPTSIISGRGREKVEGFVQLKELFYAGSHGMDIVGPQVCCSCLCCQWPFSFRLLLVRIRSQLSCYSATDASYDQIQSHMHAFCKHFISHFVFLYSSLFCAPVIALVQVGISVRARAGQDSNQFFTAFFCSCDRLFMFADRHQVWVAATFSFCIYCIALVVAGLSLNVAMAQLLMQAEGVTYTRACHWLAVMLAVCSENTSCTAWSQHIWRTIEAAYM